MLYWWRDLVKVIPGISRDFERAVIKDFGISGDNLHKDTIVGRETWGYFLTS